MNKLLWIVIILLTGWVGKLSFDVYQINTKSILMLNMGLEQQTQRLGNLNDQLVALQEKQIKPTVTSDTVAQVVTQQNLDAKEKNYDAQTYVYDRLQLIQLALEQQQFNLALQDMQNLRQRLQQNNLLSESLNVALINALIRDQAVVVTYLQQRAEHLQLLQQQLKTLEKLLQPQPLESKQQKWDVSEWFSVKKQSTVPDLAQRQLTYKQLQLQVLLAQQALLSGEKEFYYQQIKDILSQIQAYPDLAAQQSIQQLHKIAEIKLSNLPQMTALALMRKS